MVVGNDYCPTSGDSNSSMNTCRPPLLNTSDSFKSISNLCLVPLTWYGRRHRIRETNGSLEWNGKGLADLSSFHHVTPSLPRLDKLLSHSFPPEAATLALQLSNNDHAEAVALMEETRLQDLMTYRLVLSPRSSEGAASPNRRGRGKSISVVSPGSVMESEQVSFGKFNSALVLPKVFYGGREVEV